MLPPSRRRKSERHIVATLLDGEIKELVLFKEKRNETTWINVVLYFTRISPSELSKPATDRVYVATDLKYDEPAFRQSATPILWLDAQGDVRWNEAAERGMLAYLTEKQFPKLDEFQKGSPSKEQISNLCRPRDLFVLHQHWSGFFSRVLCFIAQFGQTLHSPRMAVLRGSRFSGSRGDADDFLGQGILRYFLPISTCSAYAFRSDMESLKALVESAPNAIHIATSEQLHSNGKSEADRPLLSSEFWKMDYHHVPIRKWLFDRRKTSVAYDSPVTVLANHSDEHIYAPGNQRNVVIGDWIYRNKPDAFSSDLLPNKGRYTLTWQDYVFGSFARYMFVLFFGSQNAPRIEFGSRILAEHWSSFLRDKHSVPWNINVFDNLAGLYIRRGDKSTEDSFWAKHQRWRNLSYYVKGIVDEEQRQKKIFKYVFVMTDDASVMASLQDYTSPQSKGTDEPYAREHLRGRDILYNILAPQACFDPFLRIGFDQFLVSMRFLIKNAGITIGHTDSNVFRFFREIVYAERQQQPSVQSYTYVRDAPNSLWMFRRNSNTYLLMDRKVWHRFFFFARQLPCLRIDYLWFCFWINVFDKEFLNCYRRGFVGNTRKGAIGRWTHHRGRRCQLIRKMYFILVILIRKVTKFTQRRRMKRNPKLFCW